MADKNTGNTITLEYINTGGNVGMTPESMTLRRLREQRARELQDKTGNQYDSSNSQSVKGEPGQETRKLNDMAQEVIHRMEKEQDAKKARNRELDRIRSRNPIIRMDIKELPFQVNEAINTLRGNIQLSGFNLSVIGITSAFKHEGKSSLSFQLARSFAGLGRNTLYLDCDIRNSHTMSRYRIRERIRGLSSYLCGDIELEDIVYRTSVDNLDTVFTGDSAPNPSELFSENRFRETIAKLRSLYDYVIVDTPPVNEVIDGVLILKECDGAVLVVESGVTDKSQARKAKQQLEYAGIRILGVVLNKIGTRKSGYGYGYGKYGKYGYGKYGYGYGYGYEKEKQRKKKAGSK